MVESSMKEQYYLEDGDKVSLGWQELVVRKDLSHDTVEFVLDSPAESDVHFFPPGGGHGIPVLWEDGVPYVELESDEKPKSQNGNI